MCNKSVANVPYKDVKAWSPTNKLIGLQAETRSQWTVNVAFASLTKTAVITVFISCNKKCIITHTNPVNHWEMEHLDILFKNNPELFKHRGCKQPALQK